MPQPLDIVLGELGSRVRLDMTLGAGFGPYQLGLKLADGTPVDLTGAELVGKLWRQGRPFDVLEQLDLEVDPDPATGAFTVSLSVEAIARLGALDDCKRDPMAFEWAVYVAPGGGLAARRAFYGPVALYLGAKP